jgi:hypothetical protein
LKGTKIEVQNITGTMFRSSGGITVYGMAIEKEATKTIVLGHEV